MDNEDIQLFIKVFLIVILTITLCSFLFAIMIPISGKIFSFMTLILGSSGP